MKEQRRKLSQKCREANANASTDGDESNITNNRDNNTYLIVLQELLPTKGLNYLGHIPQVMHRKEEVMLEKFILDPATLAVSVAVEDLKRNQSFGMQISFAWCQCML